MDYLRRCAEMTPDAPAVMGGTEALGEPPLVWSYRELDQWVDRVSRALIRVGVPPGGRIGMRLPPSPQAVVLLHAAMRIGAVLAPLHAKSTDAEVTQGLAATGGLSRVISDLNEIVEWGGETVGVQGGAGERYGGGAGTSSGEETSGIFTTSHPDAVAAILLTSGSTGDPRPIALTHRNLEASAEGAIHRLQLSPQDCWLSSLSPGHVGGLALLHRAAVVGCSVLTRPRFNAEEVAELIDQGAVSHLSLVPVMLDRLLEVRGDRPPPETLRCLLLGGDRLQAPLLRRALVHGYPIALTYGMTESTSQIATATPNEVRRKPGKVGRALQGVEVRIASADTQGVGEILVRGATVVEGLPLFEERSHGVETGGNDDSSSNRIPSVFQDSQGWLHTGDLGWIDADGDLEVVGRLTDRIVTAGVTVEPAEVESILLHHPKVLEVAAVGIPDPEWGERILLGVVPRDPEAPPTLEELMAFSRDRLVPAKRPRELRILMALPRNERGKVVRSRLRDP